MTKTKRTLTNVFGGVMILGGIGHFLKPELYFPFLPEALPQLALVYLSGIIELLIGVAVFTTKFRALGTLGILILMIAFLPLHIADVFKEHPAVGTHTAALIRLPLQFVMIGWAWYIHRK